MANNLNLKNCRIIIKDMEQDKTVADTLITGYDWNNNTVRISTASLSSRAYNDISVLIFGKEHLYEYYGKVKKASIANEIEILLYKGQEREERSARRYEFKAQGDIRRIKVETEYVVLNKSIPVTASNISSRGILIQTHSDSFKKKDQVQIAMKLEDRELKMECEVIRIQNANLWTEEYGCRILAIHSN